VFFESIPDHSKIKLPDSKNYVKFDDAAKKELEKIPLMNEVLRHVVPPEVRNMQSEFKTMLQNMIDQQYKQQETADINQRAFLGQYQMPQSFYELTSVNGLPEAFLKSILEFQKKGAMNNFTNIIKEVGAIKDNCMAML
jgi:hypothetical protein